MLLFSRLSLIEMPPLFSPSFSLDILVERSAAATIPVLLSSRNDTAHSIQVICAWPVSGQYGPGSRYLYVLSLI